MVDELQSSNSELSYQRLKRAVLVVGDLPKDEAASTLFRFFRSKHVIDLRLIANLAFWLFVVHLVVMVILGIINAICPPADSEVHSLGAKVVEFSSFLVQYIGPVLGVAGIIIAWAYRSASARLGVVDLFGCEISTLCRVGTIFDVGKRYLTAYDATPTAAFNPQDSQRTKSANFVSQEDYFPIFASNSRDLQLLEALVVKHITEFYTYMKATRDSLRALDAIKSGAPIPATGSSQEHGGPTPWQAAVADVIYVLFLGYESARKAIWDLIEFQPSRAENTMVILLTELRCYPFLLEYYKNDELRYSRLDLRKESYRKIVLDLVGTVKLHEKDEDWNQATRTIPELEKRYKEVFHEDIPN